MGHLFFVDNVNGMIPRQQFIVGHALIFVACVGIVTCVYWNIRDKAERKKERVKFFVIICKSCQKEFYSNSLNLDQYCYDCLGTDKSA